MRRKTLLTLTVAAVLLATGAVAAGFAPVDDDSTFAVGSAAAETESLDAPDVQTQQQQPLVRGEPRLRAHAPDTFVTPGNTNEVELQVSNDGRLTLGPSEMREVVTTARNVRVEAEADDPLTVTTNQSAVGAVTETEPRSVPIAIDVPEDVEEGTYDVDVELKYAHTRQQGGGVTDDRSRTVTRTVEVEVRDEARFSITEASTDVQIADTGTIDAEVENIGSDTARDLDVALDSTSAGLVIGDSPEAGDSARIDELEPGEAATVSYDASLSADAPPRRFSIDGTVQFRNADGIQRVDEGIRAGITPVDKQRFSIDDIESDLHVGEDGDVYGTVTNEGPNEARNVVVQYADESENVIPIESSIAVGTLGPGESADFRMPIEIGGEAEAVDRTADITVQYRNADLERRAYEDVELLFEVAPKRDQFLLEVQDREITAGETVAFDVAVTNNLDQTVEDVEARLFADDPLDSDDDEAFVESLEAGESTTMTFELEAEAGATAKTYPISFDFRYDDERGSSQLSDTTRVAISVVPADGGFPWLLAIGGLVLVAAAGGGYYLYARET
ncbi:CARDB domain-containing protein [Halorubrum gandharaense]